MPNYSTPHQLVGTLDEQIRIVALTFAVETNANQALSTNGIIERAAKFEEYIKRGVKSPSN